MIIILIMIKVLSLKADIQVFKVLPEKLRLQLHWEAFGAHIHCFFHELHWEAFGTHIHCLFRELHWEAFGAIIRELHWEAFGTHTHIYSLRSRKTKSRSFSSFYRAPKERRNPYFFNLRPRRFVRRSDGR